MSEEELAQSIGMRLRDWRGYRKLSVTELAAKSGVSKGHISQLEHGIGGNVTVAVLHKLATALDISVRALMP